MSLMRASPSLKSAGGAAALSPARQGWVNHPQCPKRRRRDTCPLDLPSDLNFANGGWPYPCAFGICKGGSAPLQRSHPGRSGRLFLPFAPRERRPRSGGTVATHDPHHTRRVADRLSVGTMLGAASLWFPRGRVLTFLWLPYPSGSLGPLFSAP